MAVYKVPQDVEAEDKLLGPFSFRQFIFLIIAVMALGIAYGLSRILLPLAIVPLPIAIFFIILALPIRKDQPMEVYVAAIISFILKPKVRLWKPDGIESLIEVIAPKTDDTIYGKGYSQEEVQKRLSYLASIVDSRGWSVRGVNEPDSSMREDLYNEAQQLDDLLDDQGSRAQQIDSLLSRVDSERRQQLIDRMKQSQIATPEPAVDQPIPLQPAQPNYNQQSTEHLITPVQETYSATQPDASWQNQATPTSLQPGMSPPYTPMIAVPSDDPDENIKLEINPYPKMNQSVLTPLSEQPTVQPPPKPQPTAPAPSTTTSEVAVSPAIIDLANNHDGLSVETLQREAKRLKEKEQKGEEVVISLR